MKRVKEDLGLLNNSGRIDYRGRYDGLVGEYESLDREIREDKEYKRIYGIGLREMWI